MIVALCLSLFSPLFATRRPGFKSPLVHQTTSLLSTADRPLTLSLERGIAQVAQLSPALPPPVNTPTGILSLSLTEMGCRVVSAEPWEVLNFPILFSFQRHAATSSVSQSLSSSARRESNCRPTIAFARMADNVAGNVIGVHQRKT